MTELLIRTAQEIDGQWLSGVLGRPGLELRSIEAIGTGQMSQSHRVTFEDPSAGTGSVVVKLAATDPTSRATGVGMGAYFREVSFYRNLAGRIGGPVPACHLAEYDAAEGWFVLVLQDVAGATQGDQIAGCSAEEAELALVALARVQAPVLGDLALGAADWLNLPNPLDQQLLTQLLPAFMDRYGDRIADEHAVVPERLVESLDAWAQDRRPPLGLVHGDYRLDNLLFDDGTCKVVDWQTVTYGPAMLDAAYFVGGALSDADRRGHEERLVRRYHDELLANGVGDLAWERCWEEYRRRTFAGIVMITAAAMVVQRTERGDDMFMTWFARNAQQVLDLDALSLLPEPNTAKAPALRPDPADEGLHAPGPEALWNESWYFDAVADSGEVGVYVRLGRLPNQGVSLYTACICGPGRPSIMLVDPRAPLPAADDDAQAIAIDGLHARQDCELPLQRFRVRVEGLAQAHRDESAPLRGEVGAPGRIALDLRWDTEGIPYAWRQSTRYEIPCRVSGTITIGDERIDFTGSGQRDHSWGARDWWAVDWMWTALHLRDGTHIHAVGLPQMPGYGVGYLQREDRLEEIETVTTSYELADNGLVSRADISVGPSELTLDVQPLAFGALRLQAPDGRVSLFPRAMCAVTTRDGRTGTGWIEWNRVQPA